MDQMLCTKTSVYEARMCGKDPRGLLAQLLGDNMQNLFGERDVSDDELWSTLFRIASYSELHGRSSIKEPFGSVMEIIGAIESAKNIIVLLGAGGSVGPDFRSPGGLYDSISKCNILDDPSDVFDIDYFSKDPSIFWRFAHTIFPAMNPKHSFTHYFIEKLQNRGKLLRVYSQNVDSLERGIPDDKLRCVHGSWRSNYCMSCGDSFSIEDLREPVESQLIPRCGRCGGFIKPGIVFFGQPTHFDEAEIHADSLQADLLLVIGTSLRVAPISQLPQMMSSVPSILINRSPVGTTFNGELLGECDDIVSMIEYELGWSSSDITAEDCVQYSDRTYVIESKDPNGTQIIETSRATFLVSSCLCDVSDLD